MNFIFIIILLLILIILFINKSIETFDIPDFKIIIVKNKDYELIHVTDNNLTNKIYKIYKN